jgi:hypothetical protein
MVTAIQTSIKGLPKLFSTFFCFGLRVKAKLGVSNKEREKMIKKRKDLIGFLTVLALL